MDAGYSIISLIIGICADLLFGDPHFLPHPVQWMGKGITFLEKRLLWETDDREKKRRKGIILVLCVTAASMVVSFGLLYGAYRIGPAAGVILEALMTYQVLAAKSLKTESMKVYHALGEKDAPLEKARKAVSMIVGRDTERLDEKGIIMAAVETVAENTSDGVIAPLLFLLLGGPGLAMGYKAVNTMDSMVGYKNDRYLDFGRAAAKTDDVCNYAPARVSAFLMCISAWILRYDWKNAFRIWRRDGRNHESPNSAQTEAACGGALGIRLAGDAYYFGKKKEKPWIGEALREVEREDIRRANRLMYLTSGLMAALVLAVRVAWKVFV